MYLNATQVMLAKYS